MDNQTRHDLETLLKEIVEKEREVIRCLDETGMQ
jgi:hypothetical protein